MSQPEIGTNVTVVGFGLFHPTDLFAPSATTGIISRGGLAQIGRVRHPPMNGISGAHGGKACIGADLRFCS